MKKIVLLLSVVMLFAAGTAQAALIAQWETQGQSTSTTGVDTIAGTSSLPGITADLMTRNGGLAANGGANSFNSKGWNNAGAYVEFGFNVANGYETTITDLWIGGKSSSTGPGSIGVFTSRDNFTNAIYTINEDGTNFTNDIINLSGLGTFAGNISIRLKSTGVAANGGTIGSGGTFRVTDYFQGGTPYAVQFNGTVTPTPIPAAAWLLGSGLLGLVGLRRKQN